MGLGRPPNKGSGNNSRPSGLSLSALGGVERAEHPDEEPAPLRRGFCPVAPSGVLPGGPHFTRIGPFAGGASPDPQAQCDPVLQRLARPPSSRRALAALAGPACEMAHVENAGFRHRPITDACMHAQFEVLLHARRSLMVALHALSAGSALKTPADLGHRLPLRTFHRADDTQGFGFTKGQIQLAATARNTSIRLKIMSRESGFWRGFE